MLTARGRRMARRVRPVGDDGVTLTEVVVSMSLSTLVGAMALSFFVWTGHATSEAVDSSFDTQQARTALTAVTDMVRLAEPGTLSSGNASAPALRTNLLQFRVNDVSAVGCTLPLALVTITARQGSLLLTRVGPQPTPTSATPCAYRANVSSSRTLADGLRSATFSYTTGVLTDGVAAATTDAAAVATVTLNIALSRDDGRVQRFRASAALSGVVA